MSIQLPMRKEKDAYPSKWAIVDSHNDVKASTYDEQFADAIVEALNAAPLTCFPPVEEGKVIRSQEANR